MSPREPNVERLDVQPPVGQDDQDPIDAIELGTRQMRRFLSVEDSETVELAYFDERGRPVVAYARSLTDQLRLLRSAERAGVSGVYTVFNALHPAIYARAGEGRWLRQSSRASDNDVTAIRAAYIDIDAVRPRGVSASDEEKHAAYTVFREVETYLAHAFGGDDALATGDSGNGHSIFVAIEPQPKSPEMQKRIDRFLSAMAKRFSTGSAKVDTSVGNPSRLCPAFGTTKRKGIDCPERPHRQTNFCCRPVIRRLPIEVL